MDSSRIYVLYTCQGSLSERSPSKNVSGNDGIRLTFRYSQPIRNSHFTMTVKKILVQQLLQTQSMVPVPVLLFSITNITVGVLLIHNNGTDTKLSGSKIF